MFDLNGGAIISNIFSQRDTGWKKCDRDIPIKNQVDAWQRLFIAHHWQQSTSEWILNWKSRKPTWIWSAQINFKNPHTSKGTKMYLTLIRWARRTWRAPCSQGRLRRGIVNLSSEEARAGFCCRMGAAPEMRGDTAPLSYPPKPCPPATTGAHCWGGENGISEAENVC